MVQLNRLISLPYRVARLPVVVVATVVRNLSASSADERPADRPAPAEPGPDRNEEREHDRNEDREEARQQRRDAFEAKREQVTRGNRTAGAMARDLAVVRAEAEAREHLEEQAAGQADDQA